MRALARVSAVSLLSFIVCGASRALASSVVRTVEAESAAVVTAGISPTMSPRQGHDAQWFFTPHITAAYFARVHRYLAVGGGSGFHFWAIEEKNGGPIFTPSLALRANLTPYDPAEIGVTVSGGWLIGHYNDDWHNGFAVTLAPNVDIRQYTCIFGLRCAVRVAIEATLFQPSDAPRTDRYQPQLALGASIGLVFPVLWLGPVDLRPMEE